MTSEEVGVKGTLQIRHYVVVVFFKKIPKFMIKIHQKYKETFKYHENVGE